MTDVAGQRFPSIRDEITALREEVIALREEYAATHPESARYYQKLAAMDLTALRREAGTLIEDFEPGEARPASREDGPQ
jgi:hypothetical protein